MDQVERVMLIRRGNELFNGKDYKNALKIFIATSYKDGIARVADVMEHEKKDKISALKLYKQAGLQGNVEKLAYEMAQAIRLLIKEDKIQEAKDQGQDYNIGYKVSGQAPEMLSSEAVRIAKQKLGIYPKVLTPAEQDGRMIPWKPITISRDQLNKK